jgi:hypothetical protein
MTQMINISREASYIVEYPRSYKAGRPQKVLPGTDKLAIQKKNNERTTAID